MNKNKWDDNLLKVYNYWLGIKLYKKVLLFVYLLLLVAAIIFCFLANKYSLKILFPSVDKATTPANSPLVKDTLTIKNNTEYLICQDDDYALWYDFTCDNTIVKIRGVDHFESNQYKIMAQYAGYDAKDYLRYYQQEKNKKGNFFSNFIFYVKYSSAPDEPAREIHSSSALKKEYFKLNDGSGFIINYTFQSDPLDRSLFPNYINKNERHNLLAKIKAYYQKQNDPITGKQMMDLIKYSYQRPNANTNPNALYYLSYPTVDINLFKRDLAFIWYQIYGLTDKQLMAFNPGKRITKYTFTIPLMYQLVNKRLKTTILTHAIKEDSIVVDNSRWIITKLQLNPNLLNEHNTRALDDLSIVVPDGNGAVIENVSDVFWRGNIYQNNKYYQADDKATNAAVVKLPLMAISRKPYEKTNEDNRVGILMHVLKGVEVGALIINTTHGFIRFYTEFSLRIEANTTFISGQDNVMLSSSYLDCPYSVEYSFINHAGKQKISYFTFATFFQEQYLTALLPTDKKVDIALEFLGSAMQKNHIIGIPYQKQIPLTTFAQAQKIKEIMAPYSQTSFFLNWQKGCLYDSIPAQKMTIFKKLGNHQRLNDTYLINNFVKTIHAQNKHFQNKTNGMQVIKGALRDNYELDIITNSFAPKPANRYYLLSPKYLDDTIMRFNRHNNFPALAIDDLTHYPICELTNPNFTPQIVTKIKQLALLNLKTNSLALKDPYFNLLLANNIIYDIRPGGRGRKIFLADVPFYETILSRYYPLYLTSTNVLNEFDHQYYFLYALLSGANPKYTIAHQEPISLKQTNASHFYSVNFASYQNEIIKMHAALTTFYQTYGRKFKDIIPLAYNIFKVVMDNTASDTLLFNLNANYNSDYNIEGYNYRLW